MFPVHTSPPSCNGYLAFAGVQIQLTALMYQFQEFASTSSECLLRAQGGSIGGSTDEAVVVYKVEEIKRLVL